MAGALRNADLAVAVIDALTSQICVLDSEGFIVAVNAAWRDFGRSNGRDTARSDIGVNYLELCSVAAHAGEGHAEDVHDGIAAVLAGEIDLYTCEYECTGDGDPRWSFLRVSPLRRPWGRKGGRGIYGAVVSHADVTERKHLEIELDRLAYTDQLTGLPNRRALIDRATETLAATRAGSRASFLLIDADHFKEVNDTHGHAGGDRALVAIGAACRSVLRENDLIARLGGEEFAVILPGTDAWGAVMTAERLRAAMGQVAIEGAETRFSVSISVGVTEFLADDRSVDDVMARADRGLYRAKGDGRDCVRLAPVHEKETLDLPRIA
ncbi:sensor domain-containing diguanylate cyclase [Arsenicitalea aurantiaca]|uniref:diguanylate cyclase n=1 Tax=Arsenicitalea aurantiaca TaxID=1783274 RepID=A0A433XEG2_9HYPH|nr:sensor domain-containing diguanylate cyclase [Arsenicitalea aurantiaca]RUT32489.1 sensor domain-containing diguanylate cyclase [Arsenicitalea aurantiaca]